MRKAGWILVLLLALAPARLAARGELPPGLGRDLFLASLQGREEVTVLALLEPGARGRVEAAARAAGGSVTGSSRTGDFAVVRLPLAGAETFLRRRRELGLVEVALDRPLGTATAPGTAPALDRAAARAAMAVNLRAIRADDFTDATGSTGRGITIAVIDTGVDPSHPDLQLTSGWVRKLVDWVDFTGEGDVATTVTVRPSQGGWVDTPLGRINLGRIPSQSGRYRLGSFHEGQIAPAGPLGQDLNRNGFSGENLLVLVTDSILPGIYDTAHVDTNGNRDFTDEAALREFRKDSQVGYFAPRTGAAATERVPFAITRVAPAGDKVNLGFDANGHGTHVAGVAAAFGAYRGGMSGIAPGARVMVLKALGAGGDGYWSDIALAMTYAAENGADVILLSLTGTHEPGTLWMETELMRRLAERHGVTFVVAAGNQGPGLGTYNAPGDPGLTLSVGAYMSAAMWRTLYGYEVAGEGLWHFSATGPAPDGGLGPATLAPGAAVATVPQWLAPEGYGLFEGTSQAVPHLGGLVALLLEEARMEGMAPSPRTLRLAVEEGSRPLAGVPQVSQGYGLAETPRVWEALARLSLLPRDLTAMPADHGDPPAGLYFREAAAVTASLRVAGSSSRSYRLAVSGPEWLGSDRRQLSVPAGVARQLALTLNLPATPGLYSGLLVLDDPATAGRDLTFPVTAVVPHRFPAGLGTISFTGELPAAASARYYLALPPGTHSLEVSLAVPRDEQGNPRGQVRLHLCRPDGRELLSTDYAGQPEGGGDRVARVIHRPQPGVWELVVAASPALSRLGLAASRFQLDVTARGVLVDPPGLVLSEDQLHRAGADYLASLTLSNFYGPFRPRTVGFGLSGSGGQAAPTLHSLQARGSFATGLPAVAPGTTYLRVEVGNAAAPTADLSLYLYHRDPVSGSWAEMACSATAGSGSETVELYSPPPGDYVVYVEGHGFEDETTFEMRFLVAQDSGQVAAVDLPRQREYGERWTVRVTVLPPDGPGDHHGLVLVRDEERGDVLAAVPVLVTMGRPGLEIELRAPPLVAGRTDRVLIRVREAGTGRLVDTVVEVNGQRHSAPRGELSYAVTPGPGPVEVRVAVRDPRYRPSEVTFRLEAAPPPSPLAWGGQELEEHRQKVRNFLLGQ